MSQRPNVPALDELLGVEVPVGEHGFIRLIDYMGNESSIVQGARVSYGDGTKTVREDAALIRYLYKHRHTSPFEMLEIKMHVKLPIFVARQWVRHRTANINEYSGRYSEMSDDFYMPDTFLAQDTKNKQGSAAPVGFDADRNVAWMMQNAYRAAWHAYRYALEQGVSREQARIVLPVANFTEWYWKIDLHNLLHFLRLRCDHHAQAEIREYADAIRRAFVSQWVPTVHEMLLEDLKK